MNTFLNPVKNVAEKIFSAKERGHMGERNTHHQSHEPITIATCLKQKKSSRGLICIDRQPLKIVRKALWNCCVKGLSSRHRTRANLHILT